MATPHSNVRNKLGSTPRRASFVSEVKIGRRRTGAASCVTADPHRVESELVTLDDPVRGQHTIADADHALTAGSSNAAKQAVVGSSVTATLTRWSAPARSP